MAIITRKVELHAAPARSYNGTTSSIIPLLQRMPCGDTVLVMRVLHELLVV